MTTQVCPTCGADIDLDIIWRQDSDGDGIWTRTWHYPDLGSEARCLACGTEPAADILDAWLDEISGAGWSGEDG